MLRSFCLYCVKMYYFSHQFCMVINYIDSICANCQHFSPYILYFLVLLLVYLVFAVNIRKKEKCEKKPQYPDGYCGLKVSLFNYCFSNVIVKVSCFISILSPSKVNASFSPSDSSVTSLPSTE